MVLQNEKCYIEISIDETYTLDSTDNRLYDIVLNPCNNKKGDFTIPIIQAIVLRKNINKTEKKRARTDHAKPSPDRSSPSSARSSA